jgi:hypothetical protein
MPERTARTQAVAVVVAALVLGLVGAGMLAFMLRERAHAATDEVTVGGLELRVESAKWEELQMNHDPGFQMPPAMMPGAPADGDQRLRLAVELTNHSRDPKLLTKGEFHVEGPGGTSWPVTVDSIGVSQLNPGLAISGGLHFDLPLKSIRKGDPGLVLVWDRAGKVRRIPIQLDGAAPSHDRH